MSDPWLEICRPRACIGCGISDGTIVPAHSNSQQFGKGMGIKAENWTVIPLCAKCHAWLDRGPADREMKRATWAQWWTLHMMGLCQSGLIQVAGHTPRGKAAQRLSKILPRCA